MSLQVALSALVDKYINFVTNYSYLEGFVFKMLMPKFHEMKENLSQKSQLFPVSNFQ